MRTKLPFAHSKKTVALSGNAKTTLISAKAIRPYISFGSIRSEYGIR